MAIKHQERITAANADGNVLSSNSFYHFYFKGKKEKNSFCMFIYKQAKPQTLFFKRWNSRMYM